MRISYELRTRAGRTVYAFDVEPTRDKVAEHEKRMGVPLRLLKLTCIEEEIER
jgi:hypothetical protein